MKNFGSDFIPPLWHMQVSKKGRVFVSEQTLKDVDAIALERFLNKNNFILEPNLYGAMIKVRDFV